MAIADVTPGLVTFPNQAGVAGLDVFFRGVNERRIPTPAVDTSEPHAALQQIHRCLITHAAAGTDIVLPAIFDPGAGIDHDDLQRRKRVADALEFVLDIPSGCDITVGQMTEVQLHARLQTPFQRPVSYTHL